MGQMKELHQIREATKKDIQDSKKAGQKACKFARKAGVSEHVAEHERDEAQREAERMEAQAETEAGKAAHRVDHVFAQARAARKTAEAQGGSAVVSLNLLATPHASAEQTPAEEAATAAATRDSLIGKAHKGIHDIMSFI